MDEDDDFFKYELVFCKAMSEGQGQGRKKLEPRIEGLVAEPGATLKLVEFRGICCIWKRKQFGVLGVSSLAIVSSVGDVELDAPESANCRVNFLQLVP